MYASPSQMEPLLPGGTPDLEDLAREIVSRSALLGGRLHPLTQKSIVELLRIINSYYSNLIEGHSTHPVDIEKAMRQDYSRNPAKRNLQKESLAHIHSQGAIELQLQSEPDINISGSEFLSFIHLTFYEQLPPDFRKIKNEETGEVLDVVPGKFREREIKVARHIGPKASTLPAFLERFSSFYDPRSFHGIAPLIAIAASHHRLMWIHPFLDGNGRVARLYTDACFLRLPLAGYGLWNVSRGLARNRERYMALLSWADAARRNDLDGRGNLSHEGLVEFCRFFLSACLDQIKFMDNLLKLDSLLEHIEGYVEMRRSNLLPALKPGAPALKKQASRMLEQALLRGEVSRGDAIRCSGMAERTGRILLAQLLEEGLLVSNSPKGAVKLGIPAKAAGYWFPDLYPIQVR